MQTTPVLMRNSERSTFRRCRLKWHWSYNLKLDTDRPKGALSFGSLVHEALAEFYIPGRKRGPKPAETFERLYAQHAREFNQWDDEGNKIAALELGVVMLEEYVKEYRTDDSIEIIQPEMQLDVDVYGKDNKYICTWVGRGDAVYKDLLASSARRPRVGFLEHKTAKAIEEDVKVISGYGEQGLSYWWGGTAVLQHLKILPPGVQIDHVLYNWLKKSLPDTRPRNAKGHAVNKPTKDALLAACEAHLVDVPKKATMDVLSDMLRGLGVDVEALGEPSARQPKARFHRQPLDFGQNELASINRRIRIEAVEMAMVRAGKLPVYKNPTKDCSWECQFRDACELHEMGQDYQSVLELEFVKWNPYDGHELLEERQ